MKIHKNHKVELVCADKFRPVLQYPHLDVESKMLVATDGKAMICVPVETEEGEVSGPVSIEALDLSRKHPDVLGMSSIHCNGSCETLGTKFPRPDVGTFPNWRQVVPKPAKSIKVTWNKELLSNALKALGNADNYEFEIELESDSDGNLSSSISGPAVIRSKNNAKTPIGKRATDGAFALIMPMRST